MWPDVIGYVVARQDHREPTSLDAAYGRFLPNEPFVSGLNLSKELGRKWNFQLKIYEDRNILVSPL